MSKLSDKEERKAWQLILGARAGIVSRDDTPAVWLERTPYAEEIGDLFIIMRKTQTPRAAADRLLAAIRKSDDERRGESFASLHPLLMLALEDAFRRPQY